MKVDVSHLKNKKTKEIDRIFDDLVWEIEQRAEDIAASILIKGQTGKKYDVGDIHQLQYILEEMGVISRSDINQHLKNDIYNELKKEDNYE